MTNRIVGGNRLPGHGLKYEGRVGMGGRLLPNPNGYGRGTRSCGMDSPPLKNTARRKQWHRLHKQSIRAGLSGRVWESVEDAHR